MPDTITVQNLSVHLAGGVGPSAFGLTPPPPCPVELDIEIVLRPEVVPHCVKEDEMQGLGVNYSSVSKAVYAVLTEGGKVWGCPADVLAAAAAVPLELPAVEHVNITAKFERALLYAECAEYRRAFYPGTTSSKMEPLSCTLRNIRSACIIGLHPHERAERQRLEVDVRVTGLVEGEWDHKHVQDDVYCWLEESKFGTLEGLVDCLAEYILGLEEVAGEPVVELTVRKPSALPFATPSIHIARRRSDYAARGSAVASSSAPAPTASASKPRVFIAVGSNIGDRIGHIRRAVQELEANGCTLRDTSRLYESKPMYVEDQDLFINGVIEISTALAPLDLLRLLKKIETSVGRTKTFRNGPRVIDLDLVLYGNDVVQIGSPSDAADADGVAWLTVPHASLAEREFVLRPLADIAPSLVLPRSTTVQTALNKLTANSDPSEPDLTPIIPFPSPARPLRLTSPSFPAVMAIFNATPDSFSDGHTSRTETSTALVQCEALITLPCPPAIIDIGGMSTRPGSTPCTEDEELARVVPLVTAARSSSLLSSVPISIDTYRASVASASIAAGASCINDVRGGAEPGMLQAMARADVPVVIMHSRGDSQTMTDPETQVYPNGVVADVRTELAERVAAALAAGVKRWNIILDPGLGFAKSHEDNLALLRGIGQLATGPLEGYAMLVGASRKGFVGRVTGRVAAERGAGDAAVNAFCAASGAVDILRVHDAQAAAETLKMYSAILGRAT